MAFQIPLHFEDLTRSTAGRWQQRPTSLREISPEVLLQQLHDDPSAVFSATSEPTSSFEALFSLITHYTSVPKPTRPKIVDFVSTLSETVTSTDSTQVKIAAYFISGLCTTASSATPVCKYWEKTGRESILEALSQLATSIPTSTTFPPADLDQISSLLVRTIVQVLEQPSAARDRNTRPILSRLLAIALTLHEQQRLPAVSALLHALSRYEHLPAPLADILVRLSNENAELTQFVAELVREIARLPSDDLARDTASAKGYAAFIGELSESMPNVFRSNLALVLSQLDGESYTMRNGVVHVIGVLIRSEPKAEDPLLDVLLERAFRDVNAFTRSKALQTWISLAEARVIPNRLFHVLADMAASRLEDKTAAVRKYAAQLLGSLLKNNPFGPALRMSHFQEKLNEFQSTENEDNVAEEAQPDDGDENRSDKQKDSGEPESDDLDQESLHADGSENEEDESELGEKENDESDPNEDNQATLDEVSVTLTDSPEETTNDTSHEAVKRRYYSFAVSFVRSVESGLETVYNMLRSKSITDVSEAVALLITAIQFQLEAAAGRAVRKMLPLVLARESNIRQVTVNAYVKLLAPGGTESLDSKESAMTVATGLSALAVGATTGELACLEALICAMFASEETASVISPAVGSVLWDLFAGKVPGASSEQRRAACMLVGMIGAERPEFLQQKVQVIETVGLKDPSLARWSCVALCKLPSGSDTDGHLCEQLAALCKASKDLSTVEQAVNAVFVISKEPELVVGSLVRDLAQSLHENASAAMVTDICRFMLVIGHVAVKELVRIEALVSQVRKAVVTQEQTEEGNNEEEEQASAEADKALELAEKELINPASLLGRYGELARKIASDRSAPAELQASAVLCMAKLMCVQEKYCEANLRLLFSILNSASDPMVRSNAVTALGDLAFRFPNLVEPWSSHIYSALQDKDDQVRKNTLMALTHLILNDMVKVKGQIVNLAICILDKNERIADLAVLFFHELARKATNAIYNILPDTISCMSRMKDFKSEQFKKVVSFLIGLMDKEKHADGMVEKLCHRFRTNETERENRDLAYCISQLNMSERCIKKMNDAFKSFSSAICDETVYTYMLQAVNKGNRSSNTPSEVVEELKAKMEAVRQSAAEAEAQEASQDQGESEEDQSQRRTRPRRTRASTRNASLRKVESEEESAEDHSDNETNISTRASIYGSADIAESQSASSPVPNKTVLKGEERRKQKVDEKLERSKLRRRVVAESESEDSGGMMLEDDSDDESEAQSEEEETDVEE